MNRASRVVCPLAVSLMVATGAFAQASDPAMEKLRTDYEQAWNKGDAKAVAALYAQDAIAVNQSGVVTRGRAGIEKTMTESLAGALKGTTIAITPGASQPLGADTAVGEGTYTISGGTGPDGKPMAIKGHYLNTLKKQGTAYVIVASAAFVPQPPPATAKTGTGQ